MGSTPGRLRRMIGYVFDGLGAVLAGLAMMCLERSERAYGCRTDLGSVFAKHIRGCFICRTTGDGVELCEWCPNAMCDDHAVPFQERAYIDVTLCPNCDHVANLDITRRHMRATNGDRHVH